MTDLTFSQAIEGFLLDRTARRRSPSTIAGYKYAFDKFLTFLGDDVPLNTITADQVRRFLTELGSGLSNKSLRLIHAYLSALWAWAVAEGHTAEHIIRRIKPPDPEERAIDPFSKSDVQALLDACGRTRRYSRPGKRECDNARPTALRDRAIILLLLDTGMRVSELCGLNDSDIDTKNCNVRVFGKGDKERILKVSAATAKLLWRYRGECRKNILPHEPFFISMEGESQRMSRWAILRILQRLGRRAGIANVHPHRFRHTFALEFLRNGANVYALQMALGHTTLQMVKRYLAIAQADLEAAHRQASPVANWRL